MVLGMELRTWCSPDEHCATELCLQPWQPWFCQTNVTLRARSTKVEAPAGVTDDEHSAQAGRGGTSGAAQRWHNHPRLRSQGSRTPMPSHAAPRLAGQPLLQPGSTGHASCYRGLFSADPRLEPSSQGHTPRIRLTVGCARQPTHHATAQEEVVLVHVELARGLQDLGAHVEAEEQFVALKEGATSVPWRRDSRDGVGG